MPNSNKKYLENKALLSNPKVKAMLDVIASAEGANYNTRVGGKTFSDLSKKPGKSTYIPSIKQNSTAEGRYQFLNSTWNTVAKELGLFDFSPESQDIAAIELIKRRGALNDILTDNFDNAIHKLAPEWASLPTASGKGYYSGQKARNIGKLRNIYSGTSSSDYVDIPQQTQQEAPTFTPFERYLTENQGLIETAQAYKEKEEVAQAKRELAQEEGFTRALQTYTQPQQQVQNQPQYQQTQSYLESPELFQLAQVPMPEFQQGGVIKDNNGYWNPNNWGKTVEISSPNITMKGVNQPLYGYAPETGERKLMLPGQDYYFEGATKVIETPLK
jgi:muramidase (phage lysozyme)